MNPKDLVGRTKLPLHVWPASATAVGCMAGHEGLSKYGLVNWRATPIHLSQYVGALKRHVANLEEGIDIDPDSGLLTLSHILMTAAIIVDAGVAGTLVDDRPMPNPGYADLVKRLTPHVKRIAEQYADRDPKHYTIADRPKG